MGGYYSQSCWKEDSSGVSDGELKICSSSKADLFANLSSQQPSGRMTSASVGSGDSDSESSSDSEWAPSKDIEENFLYYRFYMFVRKEFVDEMDQDKMLEWLILVNPRHDDNKRRKAIKSIMQHYGDHKESDEDGRVLKVGGFVEYYTDMKKFNKPRYKLEMTRLGINDDIYHHKSRYIVDLMNPIASGGFGVVYFGLSTSRADCGPNKKIAVKKLNMEWSKEQLTKRNIRELRIMRKVSGHPNIIDFHDAKIPDGKTVNNFMSIHMVMGFMKSDLESHLRNLEIEYSLEQVRSLMQQLVDGVKFLHEWHLVHRDLKPQNILVEFLPENEIDCKICDFGLARSFDQNKSIPKLRYQKDEIKSKKKHLDANKITLKPEMSKHVATRYWRAPEVSLLAQEREIVTAIDVWSLGCIFAQVLQMVPNIGCWKLGNSVGDQGHVISGFQERNGIIQVKMENMNKPGQGSRWVSRDEIEPEPMRQKLFNGSMDSMLSAARVERESEDDQLICICQYLGKPPSRFYSRFSPSLKETFKKRNLNRPKITFSQSLNAPRDAIDLLSRMLTWDPNDRIKAEDAWFHKYFAEARRHQPYERRYTTDTSLPIPMKDPQFSKSISEFEDMKFPKGTFRTLILDEILHWNADLRKTQSRNRHSTMAF